MGTAASQGPQRFSTPNNKAGTINRVHSGKSVDMDVFYAPRAGCQNVRDEMGRDRTSEGKEADSPCIP